MSKEAFTPEIVEKYFAIYLHFQKIINDAIEKGKLKDAVEQEFQSLAVVFETLIQPALLYYIENDSDLNQKVVPWLNRLSGQDQDKLRTHPRAAKLAQLQKN